MIFVTLMGCNAAARIVTREAQPLAYVGQVQLGEPKKEGGHVVVPLTYAGGEWGQNSAIVPIDVDAIIKDAEIEMTVVTSVVTDTVPKNGGRQLTLPADSQGNFTVFYRDPDGVRHEIGKLQIDE